MKTILAALLLASAVAASGCAPGGASLSMQVRSAPPPPTLDFAGDPHFSYLSDRRVSVIADDNVGYDMFSVGGSYYLYNGGYWYRAPAVRGPYAAVEARRVPNPIFDVDDRQYRWHSHPAKWRGSPRNPAGDGTHHGGDSGGNGH